MGSRLRIAVPDDYKLGRDVCSYGYFLLAPNRWHPGSGELERTFEFPSAAGPAIATTCRISHPNGRGESIVARFDRALDRRQQGLARVLIARMLRLDEDAAAIRRFHKLDPRWRRSGRGRLFRSPTMFEDVIKTVTSCNVAWPNTRSMNERLCRILGRKSPSGGWAFPSPRRLARARAGTLRARCRVGYRDTRIVELARRFDRGEIGEAILTDTAMTDDLAFRTLCGLPGVGPYSAANIMQLLGRYSRLALDTESVRHARGVLGFVGDDRLVLKAIERHYGAFGDQRFRSYWFELWADYEARRGPAWAWDYDRTGGTFTAAQLQ